MATATEIIGAADLSMWIPGTRFFGTDDGRYFVVDADLTDYESIVTTNTFVRRPTCILYCNSDASVTDLVPDFTFDPGTTVEDAILAAGFDLAPNP